MTKTVDIGKEALELLQTAIETLRSAWRGSDAKAHLTKLLVIKAYIGQFTSILYEISKAMNYQLRDFSNRTESNQGKSYQLGSFHEVDFDNLFFLNPDILDTLEVYVNPDVASIALDQLKKSKILFVDFTNHFFQFYSYLLEIWISGGKREQFEHGFDLYQKNYQLFVDIFENSIAALDRAIEIWKMK